MQFENLALPMIERILIPAVLSASFIMLGPFLKSLVISFTAKANRSIIRYGQESIHISKMHDISDEALLAEKTALLAEAQSRSVIAKNEQIVSSAKSKEEVRSLLNDDDHEAALSSIHDAYKTSENLTILVPPLSALSIFTLNVLGQEKMQTKVSYLIGRALKSGYGLNERNASEKVNKSLIELSNYGFIREPAPMKWKATEKGNMILSQIRKNNVIYKKDS